MDRCSGCGQPTDTGGNCHTIWCPDSRPQTLVAPIPKGCICPPTSEQTCQAAECPRKGFSTVASSGGSVSEQRPEPES